MEQGKAARAGSLHTASGPLGETGTPPPSLGVSALRCGVTGVAQTLGLIQMLCSLKPELLRLGIAGTLGEGVNTQLKEDTDLTQPSV